MNQSTDLIVSVHVPKTGGEAFRDTLEQLSEGHLERDYGDRPLAPSTPRQRLRLALSRPALKPDTRVVHGHFVATKYWRRYPGARYVAWFREPVERLASHYFYWRRKPDMKNPTCRRLIEEDLSVQAFAALDEMRDVQSRFLGQVPVSKLAFVGLTERYDESIELFRRSFHPDLQVAVHRQNANPDRMGARYDLDAPTREAIAALNVADIHLYAEAQARFAELLHENGMA